MKTKKPVVSAKRVKKVNTEVKENPCTVTLPDESYAKLVEMSEKSGLDVVTLLSKFIADDWLEVNALNLEQQVSIILQEVVKENNPKVEKSVKKSKK
jgi:hypothetical protein